MSHIISITTGNHLPFTEIKRSSLRRFFLMPSIYGSYVGTKIGVGQHTVTRWFYPSVIESGE